MMQFKSVGAISLQLKFLKNTCVKPTIIMEIRNNWKLVVGEEHSTYLSPEKYIFNARCLVVKTMIPPIYIMHLRDQIKEKIRAILGEGHVNCVKFYFSCE